MKFRAAADRRLYTIPYVYDKGKIGIINLPNNCLILSIFHAMKVYLPRIHLHH